MVFIEDKSLFLAVSKVLRLIFHSSRTAQQAVDSVSRECGIDQSTIFCQLGVMFHEHDALKAKSVEYREKTKATPQPSTGPPSERQLKFNILGTKSLDVSVPF